MNAAKGPRIVLHVGAPKTASTYIQRRLRANSEHLREHGVYVPILPAVAEMAGNAKLLPTALGQRPSLTFQRAFPQIDTRGLNPTRIIAELLQKWRSDSESLVLSAENLRPIHAHRLRELLPSNAPCVVVLFVRRQDRWLDSYFNQMIKTNEIHENVSAFIARLLEGNDQRLCCPDWFAYYEAWRAAFGNCNIVFYDEVASDVFGAFIAAAGLPRAPGVSDVDRAQVSLNLYELAYLLDLKAPIDYADFLRCKSASEKASRQLGVRDTRSVLSDSDLSRLRNAFEESNQRLITELGRRETKSPLELDQRRNSDSYCSLPNFYKSESYTRYRKLADAIYARRNRRDLFRSLFRRLGAG
ncbi:MAG TPA: hypothetical protein VM717_07445 [Chthoniobacterales bacterium]|nr:hypothetical protein [Chthoniobacterales bacterium]